METNPPSQPPAAAGRRKLIRGAFAVPAVLTVCSGSAMANASAMRCLSNQVNGQNTTKTVGVTTTLDTWLRVQLYQTGTGDTARYFVSGADVVTFKRPSRMSYISSTQWHEFNVATNTSSTTMLSGMPSGAVRCSRYAAVRFDANGNIIGVGHMATGAAMPGTCWTSFSPYL